MGEAAEYTKAMAGGAGIGELSSLRRRGWRMGEAFVLAAVYGAASIAVLLLAGIVGCVLGKGLGVLSVEFLTVATSELRGTVGVGGSMINTLYIVCITMAIVTPVGIGGAVYLNEYARPGGLVRLAEFATETLAGIPSVIFGLFGYVFFGMLGLDYSLLRGALTLSLMVLPLIVQNTGEALRAVPDSYRSAALGMGAPRWYMIRTVLLPAARPGILTGVILSVGRIVGESAALLFTAGSARLLPKLTGNPAQDIRVLMEKSTQSGGTLAVEMYLQMQNGRYETAFGAGSVLIIIVLAVNLLLRLAVREKKLN